MKKLAEQIITPPLVDHTLPPPVGLAQPPPAGTLGRLLSNPAVQIGGSAVLSGGIGYLIYKLLYADKYDGR